MIVYRVSAQLICHDVKLSTRLERRLEVESPSELGTAEQILEWLIADALRKNGAEGCPYELADVSLKAIVGDALLDDLAVRYLAGDEGWAPPALDHGVLSGLFWDWSKIKNTPRGDELARAIARQLDNPDPELRYRALFFLQAIDVYDAMAAVVPFVRGDRALFRNVFSDSFSEGRQPDDDAEYMLLRVLGRVIDTNEEARELAKKEALDSNGRPMPLIGLLTRREKEWTAQHRDEIERLHPETKIAIDLGLAHP